MSGTSRRWWAVCAAAVGFGLNLSVVKGNGSGVRDTLGNISAPWLLLAFAAGAVLTGGRPRRGAFAGLLATLLALTGFYLANAAVLDLGHHGAVEDVRLTFVAGRRYFALALLSGPVCGAVGAWWRRRRSMAVAILVTSSLVFEPFAWAAYQHASPAAFGNDGLVWAGEILVGLVGCALTATYLRSNQLQG